MKSEIVWDRNNRGVGVRAAAGVGAGQRQDRLRQHLLGPQAAIGEDMRRSVELALEHLGGKMGGKKIEIVYEDDQFKPDVGKARSEKLVQQDKVNFVAGYIWSNVLLASLKTVTDEGDTILISANAGPSQIAGELCNKNFFSTSWQNDQTPMAMGEYLNTKGVKSLYVVGAQLRRRQGHARRASSAPTRARSPARTTPSGPTSSTSRPS